jgi:hypothetical protein
MEEVKNLMLSRLSSKVTYNVQGLAMGWYSMFLPPERQPIEKL